MRDKVISGPAYPAWSTDPADYGQQMYIVAAILLAGCVNVSDKDMDDAIQKADRLCRKVERFCGVNVERPAMAEHCATEGE